MRTEIATLGEFGLIDRLGNFVRLADQFFAICFTHIRKTGTVRDILSAQRMFGEVVDMVSDNHQVTDFKICIRPATGIGYKQGFDTLPRKTPHA